MMPRARILIVDADGGARRTMVTALSDHGHVVAAVPNEDAALRAARDRRPELVLIDPRLPDGDGRRLVRALRRGDERPPVPLILLGEAREERASALEIGGVYFHMKPVDPWRLTFQVFRALKRIAPRREAAAPPGIRGSLSLMGLPALLSHLEAERRTGRLTLTVDAFAARVTLECRDGNLLRARLDGSATPRNADLVYALFPIAEGTFEFRPVPIAGDDEIGVPVTALLLEGARRADEAEPSGSNPDRPSRTESGSPGGSTV